MKNTGQPAQRAFEGIYLALGKKAYVYRVTDTAEVRGRAAGFAEADPGEVNASTKEQPCDFIVTHAGHTFYAEVKSSVHPKKWSAGGWRPKQKGAARMVTTAGGDYFVFIYSIARDLWFKVPAKFLFAADGGTFPWDCLSVFKWSSP